MSKTVFGILVTGFENLEQAEAWRRAYSGGVEQDMSEWSSAGDVSFPCYATSLPDDLIELNGIQVLEMPLT
jgi:hypothetical protein